MEEIRYLTDEEKNRTRPIWEKIFPEDSKRFLDYYYTVKTKDNEILAAELNGQICSMLQLNPYQLRIGHTTKECAYVIAVATDEKHRHQGWMRRLLIRAMKDRTEKKQPFLFLIPADEEIYRPFGFRFVMEQKSKDFSQKENKGYHLEPLQAGMENSAADFANSFLCENADVYVLRDADYYRTLQEELRSEDGDVAWIMTEENGRPEKIGLLGYTSGEQIEVREPMLCKECDAKLDKVLTACFPGQKIKAFGLLNEGETTAEPSIMFRILYLEALLEGFRATKEMEFVIRVHDDILSENNGVFIWKVGPENSTFGQQWMPCRQGLDLDVTVEALSQLLICGKTPEAVSRSEHCVMTPQARKKWKNILPLRRVWLNEVV